MSKHSLSDEDLAAIVLRDVRNSDGAHELARRIISRAIHAVQPGQPSAPRDVRRYWDALFRAHVAVVSAIESEPRAADGWLVEVELLEAAGVQPRACSTWPSRGARVVTTVNNLQACTR